VRLDHLKHVGRCTIPTVDPATGARDPKMQPLLFLKKQRAGVYAFLAEGHPNAKDREAFFSVNAQHHFVPGQKIRVGDPVVVSKFRNPALPLKVQG
jgi:uncharacterized protein YcbX